MDPHFVTTDWLAAHLGAPDVAIVDASWYLPAMGRDARAEYDAGHIPGAVFFPLDEIADKTVDLPHMLPDPQHFATAVGALGISETMTIVVYDELGLFSAPRVWWTFCAMGAETVRILEGGGAKWRAEERPLETGARTPEPRRFAARSVNDLLTDRAGVREQLRSDPIQVVDARPAARFDGTTPEPRPGLKAGHMPGANNLPFTELSTDGILKPVDELKSLFDNKGLDLDRPIVTTCGSGVTAATLLLALERTGARSVRLYDGSWAEWGSRSDTDIA